jgi:RimJ/RimL family protein N-acetyltransferase
MRIFPVCDVHKYMMLPHNLATADDRTDVARASGRLVGTAFGYTVYDDEWTDLGCVVVETKSSTTVEVHVLFTKDAWGKSHEALKFVCDQLLRYGIHMILGHIPEYNTLALKMAERAGFRKLGRLPETFLKRGKFYDSIIMGYSPCLG